MADVTTTPIQKDCLVCKQPFEAVLIHSGFGTLDPSSVCDPCLAAEQARVDAELLASRIDANLRASQIPEALREATFERVVFADALAGAQRWVEHGGGICLTGPVGVGKSWLAAAAVRARAGKAPTRWVSTATLLTQLRGGFSEAKTKASELVAGSGAIVLDDLDKVNPSEFGKEVLFGVIDNRVQAGAPMIVTTNLPLSHIGERLGDAVMSRLAGYCETFQMVGNDRRIG